MGAEGWREPQHRVEDPQHREQDAELWRAFVQASPDIVLVIDPGDGTILFANRTAPVFKDRQVVGCKIWDFAAGEDAEARLRAKLRQVVESRTGIHYEHPGYLDDGALGWYEVRVIPIVRGDEPVRRVLWSSRDVTERKRAQDRHAFGAALLAQVSEPVVATEVGSHITYWNSAAEKLFGWTAAEAIGRNSHELLRPTFPGGLDALLASLEATASWQGEIVMHKKCGEHVTVEASTRVLRETRTSITVMKDTTERRVLEEQLRQSQKMEAIGLLAGGVAHDFNNLLAVIVGFSELAARKVPPGHPAKEPLAEVFDAARRGGELTRKLLAFSRKQIIQPRVIDAVRAVEDLGRLLSRILGEDVQLVIRHSDGGAFVRADPVQLEQVLLNLCTNARQAMPHGGQLRLSTRLATFDEAAVRKQPWARAGAFVEIAVADSGIGMDAHTRQRAFEPFFTTKPEGTGLGLATVHGIVQQHCGFVHVESAPGEGTTFRVYLPAAGISASITQGEEGAVARGGTAAQRP